MDPKKMTIKELDKRKTHYESLIDEIEEITKRTQDIHEIKNAYNEQLVEIKRLLALKIEERKLNRGKKLVEWFGIVALLISISFFVYDFEIWRYFQLGFLKKLLKLAKEIYHLIVNLPGVIKFVFVTLVNVFIYWKAFREKSLRQAKAGFMLAVAVTGYDIYKAPIWLVGEEMYRLSLLVVSVVTIVVSHMIGFKTMVYVGLFGLSNWFGGTTGYIQGCYWLCMRDPLIFVPFGAGLVYAGYLINKYGIPDLKQPFEVMGLLNLFMALLILSIWGHWFGLAGYEYWDFRDHPHIEPIWFILVMTGVCAFFIWMGIRKECKLFFNFGVTFLVIDLYTRFFEVFPSWLPRSLFWGSLGGSLLFVAFVVKRKLLLIQKNFK